jgi:hypothetical protein
MTSSIVRGMPYATMNYKRTFETNRNDGSIAVVPTIACDMHLKFHPIVDQTPTTLEFSYDDDTKTFKVVRVEREVELVFTNGLIWLVFFSRSVEVQCIPKRRSSNYDGEGGSPFMLQVMDHGEEGEPSSSSPPLVIRVALVQTNKDCSKKEKIAECFFAKESYKDLLRRHADFYPGNQTRISYEFDGDNGDDGKSSSRSGRHIDI